ncbi:dTDP-3-amino-3,4,6-trideoxy-alpha-D-glucopyranose [Novipirellula galeiformis]|uniref:dTDP-3-amino-3,4, 6-trideoxy-alpha-D-glucopyranose n=1 Tax=Novipirellula galeiformis TaxID=2528004 RepID=A0A5C6BZ27_9BACT|nr:class I SAM-dependent methyltransferase [Novipirellula galeiformis]TWU17108.1 dTDP-3-amino-3,4,6-trideoxy-alpha-D-glucopyranose [Novipirellula galeiformis]
MNAPEKPPTATPESFGAYSRYYDLLYQDKDYAGETEYIRSLLSRFAPRANHILELGCGTGKHACLLSQEGLHVTGVERSDEMFAKASERVIENNASSRGRVEITQGDARSVRLKQTFDCILSLFHVFSYQTSNQDVAAMLTTAKTHLTDGGVFIFDLWYGPAVLALLPSTRVKRMEDEHTEVLRIAEPTLDANRNVVDVHYTMLVTDKSDSSVKKLSESHRMRYFFAPEIELFAQSAGMRVIHSEQWMEAAPPSQATWGVTFVVENLG